MKLYSYMYYTLALVTIMAPIYAKPLILDPSEAGTRTGHSRREAEAMPAKDIEAKINNLLQKLEDKKISKKERARIMKELPLLVHMLTKCQRPYYY